MLVHQPQIKSMYFDLVVITLGVGISDKDICLIVLD